MNLNWDEINRFGVETSPNKWRNVGQVLKIKDKVRKIIFLGREYLIFLVWTWESKMERKREVQDFFQRFSEFRLSEFVEQRIKVHRFDEGYEHVPKRKDFTEDPKKEIWGNQRFWA